MVDFKNPSHTDEMWITALKLAQKAQRNWHGTPNPLASFEGVFIYSRFMHEQPDLTFEENDQMLAEQIDDADGRDAFRRRVAELVEEGTEWIYEAFETRMPEWSLAGLGGSEFERKATEQRERLIDTIQSPTFFDDKVLPIAKHFRDEREYYGKDAFEVSKATGIPLPFVKNLLDANDEHTATSVIGG